MAADDNLLQKAQDFIRIIDSTIDVIKDQGEKKKAGEAAEVDDPRKIANLFDLVGEKLGEKHGPGYVEGLLDRIQSRTGGDRGGAAEEDDGEV